MKLYSIIPLLRLPRSAPDVFTYSSPETLGPGTLVYIRFRDKKIFGIVKDSSTREEQAGRQGKNLVIRSIEKTFGQIFSKSHLEFFQAIQKESFEHLGTIVQTAYNKVQWKRLVEHEARIMGHEKKKRKRETEYHPYQSPQERIDFFLEQLDRTQKLKKSLLLIIPDFADAQKVYEEIKKQLDYPSSAAEKPDTVPKKISTALRSARTITTYPLFFISSKTSPREYTGLFIHTIPCIVISSRIGIFLPQQFETIICDDEPNPRYMHEEPAPAYDVRVLASKRAQIFLSTLVFSGYSIRALSPLKIRGGSDIPLAPLTLANLADEKQKGNIIFSEDLKILAKKNPLLFILNSRDFSKKITCKTCGHIFLCPTCDRPYRAETEYELLCANCQVRESLPPLCPSCVGGDFSFSGMGVPQFMQRLTHELKSRKKILHSVSTFSDLAKLDLERFSAIAIPFFESFLTATYAATEQLVHLLVKLRKTFSGEIIIQHFSDKGPAFLEDIKKTLQEDAEFRKSYQYPPYGDIYRIRKRERNKKPKKTNKQSIRPAETTLKAGRIADHEKENLDCISNVFKIPLEKIMYTTYKKRGLSIHEFIVKLPLHASVDFRKLPQDFHVVKNPIFL